MRTKLAVVSTALIATSMLLLTGCTTAPPPHLAAADARLTRTPAKDVQFTQGKNIVWLRTLGGQPWKLEGYNTDLTSWERTLPVTQGYGPVTLDVKQVGHGAKAQLAVHYLTADSHGRGIYDEHDYYNFAGDKIRTVIKPTAE